MVPPLMWMSYAATCCPLRGASGSPPCERLEATAPRRHRSDRRPAPDPCGAMRRGLPGGRRERQREAAQPVEHVARLVLQLVGRDPRCQAQVGEPFEEDLEPDAALGPGQRGAEAVVLTPPEGEVLHDVAAGRIDGVGRGEAVLVPVA